ncbi:Beta-glucuronidase [Cytospora mali]|uniref:Beta-glucuronidase n=1 Tax=Cytospora mali TaxID=578113 RepID=A0A194V9V1_CYTMA|nr:Beta-glucuronidase [Valsa mali var. pyri (nom. inval.)]
MWLPEDVLGTATQEAIYDAVVAIHTEATPRAVFARTVEMASKVVPRYMQHVLGWLAVSTAAAPFVSVPSTVPANASGVVDPDFAGFAFEQASLWNYALDLDGNPNVFSQNLIAEITNRTGGKPLIRIGGTSADYAYFIENQTAPALPRAEVYNYQDIGGTTIGPSFWDLCKSFPDALYIIQTPLAITDVSETVLWATSVVKSIGIDAIHSFEPGNEPDLYPVDNLGPPTYLPALDNASYVGNFKAYAAAIIDAVEDIPSEPFFQAFDVSVHLGDDEGADAYIMDVPTCFGLGIDDDNIVKTVAHHYYQTNGGGAADLAAGLMSHSAITGHLDLFKPAINWLKENKPDIPYIMSEIGNSLNPTHDYSYQAVLGSALWQVDFQLYSLAIGIARFNFQQIMHSGYDMWLPVASNGSQPQVFASYYAQPFVTDFVGSSGKTQIAQLDIEDEATGNWAGYAAFEDGVPKRLAFLNLNYWNSSSSTAVRASQTITIAVPDGVTSVTVDLLSSPLGAGASADTITYGGSQWTYESLGKEVRGVRNDTQTLAVEDGEVTVTINQSSAVLLHLES